MTRSASPSAASRAGAWITSQGWSKLKGRAHHHDLRRRPERDRPGQRRPSSAATEPSRRSCRTSAALLDDKSIDAISIATPNHWHALATIWACQAGKDVYVEKPVSHNVSEGRRMVEAARKYDRIVQTGTQCRSHQGIQDAIAFLRSGKLGQIYMAKGLCYKPRGSIGHKPDGPVPAGRRLRPLARPGAQAAVQPQPLPLQLALELGLRQRRPRQPGHPPDGPGPLGSGQERAAQGRHGLRRPVRLLRRRPDAQHAARRLRVRRLRAPVRGPRAASPTTRRRSRSATSSTAPRASWPSPATRHWQVFFGPKLETGPGRQGRGRPLRQLRQGGQGARPQALERRHRSRATSRAPTATWATSPTGWAASSTSTPRPSRSSTIPRPTPCSLASIAHRSSCRPRFDLDGSWTAIARATHRCRPRRVTVRCWPFAACRVR